MQYTGWVAQLSLCVSQSVYVCVDVISLMSAKNEFTSVSLLLFFTLVTKILQLPQSCPLLWVKNLKVQVMLCSLLVLSLCSVILLQLQHCCCFSEYCFHSFFSLVSMAFLFFPKKSDTQTALRRPSSTMLFLCSVTSAPWFYKGAAQFRAFIQEVSVVTRNIVSQWRQASSRDDRWTNCWQWALSSIFLILDANEWSN